jgi:Arc/MetJ-type ribon-helix-helix transcriptional regulator
MCMETLSPELLNEIERRVAEGPYASADELIRHALTALDDAQAWLDTEAQKVESHPGAKAKLDEWDDLERQALEALESMEERKAG